MKKLLSRSNWQFGAIVSLLLFMLAGGVQAATISFNPQNLVVPSGSGPFSLNIVGSGFTNGSVVGSYGGGLNVSYDPGLLQLDSVNRLFPGDMSLGNDGAIDNVTGTLTGLAVSSFFFGATTSDFDIATLNFSLVGPVGTSNNTIGLSVSDVWTDGAHAQITPTIIDGTVQIAAAPVPPAVLLFASGIIGLVTVSRRKARDNV